MHGGYTHLTKEERDMVAVLRAQGTTLSGIAWQLGRHKATIPRELKRNVSTHRRYYLSHKAQERSEARWATTHKRERLKNKEIKKYVEAHLRRGWSPEIIAHRLSIEKPGESISHETIYQYIYEERKELVFYLARGHRKRMKKGHSRKYRKSPIPNRISISERPEIAEKRERIGDWENDTIVSRQSKVAINVLTDRKSRVTLLKKLRQKTAEDTKLAILELLGKYPASYRHTITYDNGSENVRHEEVNKILDTKSYFCEPYHSWEKGTVENTIGLIRRWIPKKTDLAQVSEGIIMGIEKWLNNRPRKCLNYQTPLEVLEKERSVALAG